MIVQRESYVHGNSDAPLIGKTIGALLDDVSASDGAREALVVEHQKVRWTYAELKAQADAFASGSWPSASIRATGSGSGRRTARNGRSRSSPRRKPV
jgi:acyl-CoA synthetase (AMP-forming)/AMP-acid ligase II